MKIEQEKHQWTLSELQELYNQPLLELISQANVVHGRYHDRQEVQACQLASIKTGGCPEDCRYCAQSSRYTTGVSAQPLMPHEEAMKIARQAIERGATRLCLGAAWREVRDSRQFEDILRIVKDATEMGLEVCCTLGMLKESQAKRLKEAGLYAYNHNLDSSESFYKTIITTRTYQDRLQTLDIAEQAGLSLCCGAILGMGESINDRLEFLQVLANRKKSPESVPINRLVPIPGTPLEERPILTNWEMVRLIAATRIVLPTSMIRLSAGRSDMSDEEQALCFLAGANSVFFGEALLTVANNSVQRDEALFELFGLKKQPAFAKGQFSSTCIN